MIDDLVARLLAGGVTLLVEEDRLVCRAPVGALTQELRAEIGRNKEALLQFLAEASRSRVVRDPIARIEDQGPWIPSTAQERFWLMENLRPGEGVYNLPGAFRLEGPLDPQALERALGAFVARHDILNVCFEPSGSGLRLVPVPSRPLALGRVSLVDVPAEAREGALRDLLETWAEEPLDLESGDLFRARLVALSPEEHALFVLSHAAVWDGWSFDVLLNDLATLYPAHLSGNGAPGLPDLPIQYSDYARWQRRRLADGAVRPQMDYWRARLAAPLPVPALPTDRPRPPHTFSGARINFRFEEQLLTDLGPMAHAANATVFMVLLAAFGALLHRYTRQDDTTILTPVRGRDRHELEGLVGCFSNLMPMRIQLDPEWSFAELLRRVREDCLDGYSNADAPFELLAGELEHASGRDGDSLFRVTFAYQNAADRARGWGDVGVRSIARDHRRCYSEASLWVREHATYLDGALDYRTDLFLPSTMERFLEHYGAVLREVVRNPDVPLADLLLLADGEDEPQSPAAQVGSDRLPTSVSDAVWAWASSDPERPALEADGVVWTYRELVARAEVRARELAPIPRTVTQLDFACGPDAVVTALAALRSGARCGLGDGDIQGVCDEHVAGVVRHLAEVIELRPDDTVLVPGLGCRPAALFEVLLPLFGGARAVLAGQDAAHDEWVLADALGASKASVLALPTALCGRLLDTGWEGGPELRVLCLGGPPRPDAAERLAQRTAATWWVDGYPEAGGWSFYGAATGPVPRAGFAHPLPGVTVEATDAQGRTLSPGVPGELTIRPPPGDGSDPGVRPFRTGELGRSVDDRTVQRLGRLDRRISIEDLLVDPAETERLLKASLAIRDAAVVPRESVDGEPILVAYVVWREGTTDMTATEVRALVREALPEPFVPRVLVGVDAIALLPDGAPDASALPNPFDAPPTEAPAGVPPRTPDEEAVASVWRELLGVERIGVHDNFFQLGGSSLILLTAVGLIENRTGRRLDPRVLFFHPLEGVARALSADLLTEVPPS